ncbi:MULTISPECIES: hypothetical protein [Bacillaceae]|uniref:hypothetical protein n=1 Tax=Bacillaceae TaxID=186817 RepID=UPI001050CE8B|nr:hypothetical protein [Bacillus sp. CBEL-1]TDB50125.1 hypothetical protein EPL02_13725 [Bacillus sp. CBEL-1]
MCRKHDKHGKGKKDYGKKEFKCYCYEKDSYKKDYKHDDKKTGKKTCDKKKHSYDKKEKCSYKKSSKRHGKWGY